MYIYLYYTYRDRNWMMIHHDLFRAITNQVTLNHGDMVRIGLVKWTFSFELPRDRRTERTPKRPKVAVEDRKEREKGKVGHTQKPWWMVIGCGFLKTGDPPQPWVSIPKWSDFG